MYRTYKNIFRVRAEVTSISAGPGRRRIVLPEGWAITADVVIIFVVLLPILRYIIAPLPAFLLAKYLNVSSGISFISWIVAIVLSGFIGIILSKKEPAGKTSIQYIACIFNYFLRNKWHDGWDSKRIRLEKESENSIVRVSSYEEGCCGDVPARAIKLDHFELLRPAAVKVRQGKVRFTRRGERLLPGHYKVEKSGVTAYIPKNKIVPPSW